MTMQSNVLTKKLYESLVSFKSISESVGKSTFGGVLTDRDIRLLGKKLKNVNVALNKLKFVKAQPKQYRFSAPRKRFVYNTDATTRILVCVDKSLNTFATFKISPFDLRGGDSNRHFILSQNIVGFENPIDYIVSMSSLSQNDLKSIQTLVNSRDTVIYTATVQDEDYENFRNVRDIRWDNTHVKDELVRKNKVRTLKTKMFSNPKVKELKGLMKQIGYSLDSLFAYEAGRGYAIRFERTNVSEKFAHGPTFKYKFNRPLYNKEEYVFEKVILELGWSNQEYENGDIDEVVERIQTIKKIIECLKSIKVKDLLFDTSLTSDEVYELM